MTGDGPSSSVAGSASISATIEPRSNPRDRPYGQACARCREKKRRCQPGSQPKTCSLCENDGMHCEVIYKRNPAHKERSGPPNPTPTPPALDLPLTSHTQSSSNFHPPLVQNHSTSQDPRSLHSPISRQQHPRSQSMYEWPGGRRGFPDALTSAPDHLGESSLRSNGLTESSLSERPTLKVDENLLKTYFAWQCPQLMPVDEMLFRRDMNSTPTGPYFSLLLLYVLQAQASRHIASDEGWTYSDKANSLLLNALSQPPTIPTIQALLVLSGRDLALGQASAAWLKSGMAFRMIDDLQIREEIAKQGGMAGTEAGYMRRRTFWSAYAWDKFFALTLGRRPTFSSWSDDTDEIPPTFQSSSTWHPYHPTEIFPAYVTQPSLEGEAFFASCLVYQEIERIINKLYRSQRVTELDQDQPFIQVASARLLQWRRKVPNILLDTSYLPQVSPPPHILTVNILYRVAWILLYRPLRTRATSMLEAHDANQICTVRSAEINILFGLHERTFRLCNITYLLAYMAYVTATIDVDEALCGDQTRSIPAKSRLELTLRVLTQASQHTPGIQRSIHHLRQQLAHHLDRSNFSGTTTPTTAHPSANVDLAAGVVASVTSLDETSFAHPSSAPINSNLAAVDLGFEELFASLLPEYATNTSVTWDDLGLDSMAAVPNGELDWMWA